MVKNIMKIVSKKSLSFFFMNEKEVWGQVSNNSELSREKFTSADISKKGKDILSVIDRDYNITEKGVDIQFEGPEEEFKCLKKCIEEHFKGKNISCHHQKNIIAVAGKIGSGKTVFIEEMCKYAGETYRINLQEGCIKYIFESSNTVWYEIAGIDIGKENVYKAQSTFDKLASEGVTHFIYCLSTNKIEKLEEEFIAHVVSSYPSITVLLLLTQYINDDISYVEQLSERLNGIKVIPVLARRWKTRNGSIEPYGLDDVRNDLFEGK